MVIDCALRWIADLPVVRLAMIVVAVAGCGGGDYSPPRDRQLTGGGNLVLDLDHLVGPVLFVAAVIAALAIGIVLFIAIARSHDDAEVSARESWRAIKPRQAPVSRKKAGVYAQVRPPISRLSPTLFRQPTLIALGLLPLYALCRYVLWYLDGNYRGFIEHLIGDLFFMLVLLSVIAVGSYVALCLFALQRSGRIVQGEVVELMFGKRPHCVYGYEVETSDGKREYKCRDLAKRLGRFEVSEGSSLLVRYLPRFPGVSRIEGGL